MRGGENYTSGIATADRGPLHLEARVNYESIGARSAFIGWNFSGGDTITWELTPLLGGAWGTTQAFVPGLEATGWFVLFAKKGTPPARIRQINEAVNAALISPEVVQKLATTANYPVGGSVDEARAFVAREKKLWAAAVKRAGLQPE